MKFYKRISRIDRFQAVLCWLLAWYIRLVHATTRWAVVGGPELESLVARGTPIIVCFWHGRLLSMGPSWPYCERTHILISRHPDGRLIARTISHFGVRTVTGSSTRGGGAALRAMLKLLAAGEFIGITPDGPSGPRMRASSGAVTVARMSGGVLLPIASAFGRRHVLPTWDRLALPLPFSRGVHIWGEPIAVARDADDATIETIRQRLEDDLNRITADADRRCGHSAIEPAPRPDSTPARELPDTAAPARTATR